MISENLIDTSVQVGKELLDAGYVLGVEEGSLLVDLVNETLPVALPAELPTGEDEMLGLAKHLILKRVEVSNQDEACSDFSSSMSTKIAKAVAHTLNIVIPEMNRLKSNFELINKQDEGKNDLLPEESFIINMIDFPSYIKNESMINIINKGYNSHAGKFIPIKLELGSLLEDNRETIITSGIPELDELLRSVVPDENGDPIINCIIKYNKGISIKDRMVHFNKETGESYDPFLPLVINLLFYKHLVSAEDITPEILDASLNNIEFFGKEIANMVRNMELDIEQGRLIYTRGTDITSNDISDFRDENFKKKVVTLYKVNVAKLAQSGSNLSCVLAALLEGWSYREINVDNISNDRVTLENKWHHIRENILDSIRKSNIVRVKHNLKKAFAVSLEESLMDAPVGNTQEVKEYNTLYYGETDHDKLTNDVTKYIDALGAEQKTLDVIAGDIVGGIRYSKFISGRLISRLLKDQTLDFNATDLKMFVAEVAKDFIFETITKTQVR